MTLSGIHVDFPSIRLACHANIVSCRLAEGTCWWACSTPRKRKLEPQKILSWTRLIFNEYERLFQPVDLTQLHPRSRKNSRPKDQTERAPWSGFAKEGNSVFIDASRRGRNAGRVVVYPETGCNIFSLCCGEVRREISENGIDINNLIRPLVKQSWGSHVNQNIIYQLLKHIYWLLLICERQQKL